MTAAKAPLFSRQTKLFGAALLVAGVAVAALSARGEPQRKVSFELNSGSGKRVLPSELAGWVIEGRRDFAVVDLRSPEKFRAGHVKGAVNCGSCHGSSDEGRESQKGEQFVDLSKKLVLYTESGTEPVQLPKMLSQNPRLFLLEGGYAGWKAQILAPVAFGGELDESEVLEKRKKEAVRAFFAGERMDTVREAKLPVTPIRRQNAHKPAAASEGC